MSYDSIFKVFEIALEFLKVKLDFPWKVYLQSPTFWLCAVADLGGAHRPHMHYLSKIVFGGAAPLLEPIDPPLTPRTPHFLSVI